MPNEPRVEVKGARSWWSYLLAGVWVAFMVVIVALGGILIVGMVQSMLPRPPLTAEECEDRIACLEYLADHSDVARELIIEVHDDVLHQSEPRSTSASREVDGATITYSGFWSPNGIPENLWNRIFTVESEGFSCYVEVNSMYADVEGDGIIVLLAQERASLEARAEAAREEP